MMKYDIPEIYQKDPWPTQAYEPILIEIGRIIFNWNSIENGTRNLLNLLLNAGSKADILTAHMGTQGQIDALKTIANKYLSDEEKEAIIHMIKLYERLRSYRNYFVHGFSSLTFSGTVTPQRSSVSARMSDVVAKGDYRRETMTVNEHSVKEFSSVMRGAVHYHNLLFCYFRYSDSDKEEHQQYKALPEIFPIPPKLSKEQKTLDAS